MTRACWDSRGFSIIETLVVTAMLLIIMAVAAPMLSTSLGSRGLANYTADAVDAIREAQAAAMNGRNDARYGVHFAGSAITFFQGSTYSGSDPTNFVHNLSDGVSVSAVSFSPGGACTLPGGTGNCDIHFSDRRGTPDVTGTIILTEAGGLTKTIIVNAAGMVDWD